MWSFNWDGSAVDSALYATSAITITQGVITLNTTGSANAPAARVTINSTGNVGIGTTTPTEVLDLRGVFRVSRSGVNDSGIIAFGNYVNGAGYYDNGIFRSALNAISTSGNILHMGSYEALVFTTSPNPLGSQTIRMYISGATGNVGIGTSSPSYLLDVNGTARVTTLIETSALKYKTNIQPLESQLSKILQLQPVTFDWIDKPNPKPNIGLIADEVEKIYPEFVSKTENGEIEGIEYSKLTAVLIQSIKELKDIIDNQQEQINRLLNK
jgi:hypothetical protein